MVERTIDRFLDREGRVAVWPRKSRDRSLVLEYLAGSFATGERYTERDVNVLLNERHTWNDPAFLRRMLYNEGYLNRTPDGAEYWRRAGS